MELWLSVKKVANLYFSFKVTAPQLSLNKIKVIVIYNANTFVVEKHHWLSEAYEKKISAQIILKHLKADP